jgi:uncharacterized protein (TIGR00251 family)
MGYARPLDDGVLLSLRVVPRAARNGVAGLHGDQLKIRLQAPPVEGKANQALLHFLSDALQVSTRSIRIVSGETGRNKRVHVAGISVASVQQLLGV